MINRVVLVGRLTRDPELRYGQSGTAVTKFTVACDRRGGEEADFIQIVTFRKTAEACAEHLRKGRLVAIEGRWQTGRYESEGRTVYTNDCIADNVRFLESNRDNGQSSSQPNTNKGDPFSEDGKPIDIPDDALPF
ncbi:single-stranded DNA-binding protein [Paenibacillus sp. JCM 10914]|uniref:single-stranded DNA-binding protein n=1 Tax=Paenibacillus sp. JCM 10914 TaxID=1236974 RepID=UPI0003CC6951|nr:single-stranded DNA-binding protein [Paenibacillus sp. JCM 10914]GAE09587.1 single-stranded DNA-binding protein [Paenibacillus sp. JCM 10914]